jgi:hypothetical protein
LYNNHFSNPDSVNCTEQGRDPPPHDDNGPNKADSYLLFVCSYTSYQHETIEKKNMFVKYGLLTMKKKIALI